MAVFADLKNIYMILPREADTFFKQEFNNIQESNSIQGIIVFLIQLSIQ